VRNYTFLFHSVLWCQGRWAQNWPYIIHENFYHKSLDIHLTLLISSHDQGTYVWYICPNWYPIFDWIFVFVFVNIIMLQLCYFSIVQLKCSDCIILCFLQLYMYITFLWPHKNNSLMTSSVVSLHHSYLVVFQCFLSFFINLWHSKINRICVTLSLIIKLICSPLEQVGGMLGKLCISIATCS
jgi:hypothetical protein